MEDEVISIMEIIDTLKSKWRIITSITFVTVIMSIIYSLFLVSPIYSSNVKIFIGKGATSKSEYSSSDLELYKNLVKTYSEIIMTDDLLQKAIDNNGLNMSISQLKSGLNVNQGDDTQIMTIKYSSSDNYETKEALDAVTNQFIIESKELIPNGKAEIIQNSQFPKGPSNNNYLKNILISFFIGIILGSGIVVLVEYFRNTLKSKDEIEKLIGIPVIGIIPNESI